MAARKPLKPTIETPEKLKTERKILRTPETQRLQDQGAKHLGKLHAQSVRHSDAHNLDPSYSSKTKYAFDIGDVPIGYRLRENSSVEQRRYYAGQVQIAYVRIDDKGFHCYLQDGTGSGPLMGHHFKDERDLRQHLTNALTIVKK